MPALPFCPGPFDPEGGTGPLATSATRTGGNGFNRLQTMGVDGAGNVHLAGFYDGASEFGGTDFPDVQTSDAFFATLASDGGLVASRTFPSPTADWFTSVAVSSDGSMWASASAQGSMSFGGEVFSAPPSVGIIARYALDGTHLFSAAVPDVSWRSIIEDGSGGVWCVGEFSGTVDLGGGALTAVGGSNFDSLLAHFDAAGDHVWSGSFGAAGLDVGFGVARDAATGDVAVTLGVPPAPLSVGGPELQPFGRMDAVIARFTSTGQHVWSRRMGSSEDDLVPHIIAAGGFTYVAGAMGDWPDVGGCTPRTQGAARSGLILAKLDVNGDVVWARSFVGTPRQANRFVLSLVIDERGGLFLSGFANEPWSAGGPATLPPGSFVARYDLDGHHIWSRSFDTGSNGVMVAPRPGGGVIMSGRANGLSIDVGTGPLLDPGDVFFASLDP